MARVISSDPWSKSFKDFKTYYKTTARRFPEFAIFDASEFKTLIDLGATHFAVYPVPDPKVPSRAVIPAVAVAKDANGIFQRVKVVNGVQYVIPLHNCPPDCYDTSIPLIVRLNLHEDDSID